MREDDLDVIKAVSESLEDRFNQTMKDVLEQYDPAIAMNIMINVGTSMLAKSLIMCEPEARAHVELVAMKIIESKMVEGHAAVQSLMAIGKAMGGGSTCKPWVPKKD